MIFTDGYILKILISIIIILIVIILLTIIIDKYRANKLSSKNNQQANNNKLANKNNYKARPILKKDQNNAHKNTNKHISFNEIVEHNDGTKKNSKNRKLKQRHFDEFDFHENEINNINNINVDANRTNILDNLHDNYDHNGPNLFEMAGGIIFDNVFNGFINLMNDFIGDDNNNHNNIPYNNTLYNNIPIIVLNGGHINYDTLENNARPINIIDTAMNNTQPITIRNDTQNVHDSLMTEYARDTYRKIINSTKLFGNNKTTKDILDEMIIYYRYDNQFTLNEVNKIINLINETRKENIFSVFENILHDESPAQNESNTEDKILANVWNRTKHPSNANNRDNMRYNLGKAMVECYNNGEHLECFTGRITRYLSALEVNDFEIKPTKTKDILRQEILNKASLIIREEIDKCYNDPNCEWHECAKSYKDNIEIDDNEFSKGKDYLISKIDALMNEFKKEYNNQFGNTNLNDTNINYINLIREEIIAGIN